MKKYILIIVAVALMCSCNGDIYDNIEELVNQEKVYPAGYNQDYVKAYGGIERVEIDLWERRVPDSALFLPKAVRTVVEYSGKRVEFEPARSWVNITGLTVAQVYRFKIYTEDEFGDKSKPVETTGKPFSEDDKGALVVASTIYASTTQGQFLPAPSPDLYTLCSVSYNYTNKNGTVIQTDKLTTPGIFNLDSLAPGSTTPLHISYEFKPKDVVDTVVVSEVVQIKTMTTVEFNNYMNESQPFPNNTPRYLTDDATTPLVIPAADFDLGGEGKGFHKGTTNGGQADWNYRPNGGDISMQYGLLNGGVFTSIGLYGIGWAAAGDWYAYTIDVQNPGEYQVEYNESSSSSNCQAGLTVDALDVLGIINIYNTGNWGGTPAWTVAGTVKLSTGNHKLKWKHQNQPNYDFGGLRLTYVGPL